MSKIKYHFIGIIIYAAVSISAILSARYGYILAGDDALEFERYIMAATFAIFDLVVALFAAEASNKWLTKAAAKILFVTLFGLSALSGAAYMLGNQAQGQGMRVAMLERQIDRLDEQMGMLDPIRRPGNLRELRKERERAYAELQMLIERQGGEINRGNAIFIYAGKATGMDPDAMAMIMRLIAMVSLNLSGIVLAAWREQSRVLVNGKPKFHMGTLSSTLSYDLYEDIKRSVIEKRVKPSVKAIAETFCSNNRNRAGKFLEMLEKDKVICNMGHGKRRMVLV